MLETPPSTPRNSNQIGEEIDNKITLHDSDGKQIGNPIHCAIEDVPIICQKLERELDEELGEGKYELISDAI